MAHLQKGVPALFSNVAKRRFHISFTQLLVCNIGNERVKPNVPN
jgi:hypothetical protein